MTYVFCRNGSDTSPETCFATLPVFRGSNGKRRSRESSLELGNVDGIIVVRNLLLVDCHGVIHNFVSGSHGGHSKARRDKP
jgi:hypothetical protein